MWRLAVICVFTFAAFFAVSCGARYSEGDIRVKIEAAIPAGSSKSDVIRYLEANSFDYIVDPNGVTPPPPHRDHSWVAASLEQKTLWRTHYTVVDFFFDRQNDSLIEYKIRSFYPGK